MKHENARKNIRSELSRFFMNKYAEAGKDIAANVHSKGMRRILAALGKLNKRMDTPKAMRKNLKDLSKFFGFNRLEMTAIRPAAPTGTKDHI